MTHPQDGVPSKPGLIHSTWSIFLDTVPTPHPRRHPGRILQILAQARLHQLWRPRRPDFDDAPGTGGETPLDFEHRYLHALNYCMLLPGPEATQLAIYISWLMHGVKGGVIAGVLFFLPSFLLLSALAGCISPTQPAAGAGIFYGIRPGVVAIVLFAAWRIGSRALKNECCGGWRAGLHRIFVFDIAFPWIVLAAGLLGALGGKFAPHKFRVGGGHGASHAQYGPAIIDDDTPPPAHARFHLAQARAQARRLRADWLAAMGAIQGVPTSTTWATSSPAAFSPSAAPMPCCPTSTRGGVGISSG